MSKKNNINYRKYEDYQSVDIDKLRPSNSYSNLISKRSHPIDQLVKQNGKIPDDFLHLINCPNCNSSKYKFEIKKDHLNIVKCNDCNLVFTNPIFDEDHYKQIYKSRDYQEIVKSLGEESHNYRVKRFGTERINHLLGLFNNKEKIKHLDIGCSTGFVVEAAIEKNWESIGIDLNPSAIEFGKSRGLPISETDLMDIKQDSYYDVVSMYDVLEHLYNPSVIIKKSRELLKDGGLLHIYVPNYDSASRYLMGKDAHFIWPSHHLIYFTISTITNFLERRNFDVIDVQTEGLDIFDYIWKLEQDNSDSSKELIKIADKLQFFVNAGCYGKNLRITARLFKK
tara:strand:- start:9257 stop:10273 length:1017 start_codon:yes stop_codon:yes gene_type:complete